MLNISGYFTDLEIKSWKWILFYVILLFFMFVYSKENIFFSVTGYIFVEFSHLKNIYFNL